MKLFFAMLGVTFLAGMFFGQSVANWIFAGLLALLIFVSVPLHIFRHSGENRKLDADERSKVEEPGPD